jgi:MoaA/NifB/PqqE/SkfB family radical SAM enzyme
VTALTSPAGGHLRRLMTAAASEYRPLSAMVELTHRCHLACVHCYLDDNHDWAAKSRELRTDEATRLVRRTSLVRG